MNVVPHRDLGLEAIVSPPATADRRQQAEATAGHFEQIFVQQMVRSMRSTIGGSEGMFGTGAGSGTYEDWFDLHLGRHLAENGGIGLAQTLLRDWERRGFIEPRDNETKTGGIDVRS